MSSKPYAVVVYLDEFPHGRVEPVVESWHSTRLKAWDRMRRIDEMSDVSPTVKTRAQALRLKWQSLAQYSRAVTKAFGLKVVNGRRVPLSGCGC